MLVALSAANTLHQNLGTANLGPQGRHTDMVRTFADAAGRFADACEKIPPLAGRGRREAAGEGASPQVLSLWKRPLTRLSSLRSESRPLPASGER
jgi:hypothetical protein